MKENHTKHKKVFICSPFHPQGNTAMKRAEDLRRNREMARLACGYAVSQGCMPMAPHLFFPTFLSEKVPEEREMGIRFGLEWLAGCDELWIIGQRITEGMKREIAAAKVQGIPIKQQIPCLVLDGRLLDMLSERKAMTADPGYEEDDYHHHDDEEEGLIYDGD